MFLMKKELDIPCELFWDTDVTRLDPQENKQYIIDRTLELGDEKAVRWLFLAYSHNDIKKALKKSRIISRKSSNYWNLMLAK